MRSGMSAWERRGIVRKRVQALALDQDTGHSAVGILVTASSTASGMVSRVARASSSSLCITTTQGMPLAALLLGLANTWYCAIARSPRAQVSTRNAVRSDACILGFNPVTKLGFVHRASQCAAPRNALALADQRDMENPAPAAARFPKEGLRDLLEHVRLVHFTMLLIGLVLLTASLRGSRGAVERAIRDRNSLKVLMAQGADIQNAVLQSLKPPLGEGWNESGFARVGDKVNNIVVLKAPIPLAVDRRRRDDRRYCLPLQLGSRALPTFQVSVSNGRTRRAWVDGVGEPPAFATPSVLFTSCC
jgi:hypothetical protein